MAYKKKGKSKKKVWTAEEKAQWLEDKKNKQQGLDNDVAASILRFFGENKEKASREAYMTSKALKTVPVKYSVFKNKEDDDSVTYTESQYPFNVAEMAQINNDEYGYALEDVAVPVFITFEGLSNLLEKYKDELDFEKDPNTDPDRPIKGKETRLAVIGKIVSATGEDREYLKNGDAINKYKKRKRKKGMSETEINNSLSNWKISRKNNKYFALEDFKDILPKKVIDAIPEFAMQKVLDERAMNVERMNLDAKVDAELMKYAVKQEFGDKVAIKEGNYTPARCGISKDLQNGALYLPTSDMYTSHMHELTTTSHEINHLMRMVDHRSLGEKVGGVYPKEEGVVELANNMNMAWLGYDYTAEEHAAYIIEMLGDDPKVINRLADKAQKIHEEVKGIYNKHVTPELRLEMENKVKEDIANKYGQEAKQELENTKGNKRSGQRLRA